MPESDRLSGFDLHRLRTNGDALLDNTPPKKPTREPAAVKPVIKVAIEVAEEHIEHLANGTPSPYQPVDVATRLRAAICLAEDAGLSTHTLVERELKIKVYEQRTS